MQIKTLALENFRNYASQKITFDSQFNLIIGQNAQGKTNLIEAIYYLAYLKSFRTSQKKQLLGPAQDFLRIESEIINQQVHHDIHLTLTEKSRKILVDQKKPKLLKDYFGQVAVLLFEPRDVYLMRVGPSQRRDYLDRALFLEDPGVLSTIKRYKECVTARNRFLKQNDHLDIHQWEVWDHTLATTALPLLRLRKSWLEKINQKITDEYQQTTSQKQSLQLVYHQPWLESAFDYEQDDETLKNQFLEELNKKRDHEKLRRETLLGPHRDDWTIELEGENIGSFGSQGENRSAIIALKAAQIKLFHEAYGYVPIFLLDDIASELDQSRVESLFGYLAKSQGQVFLTTTTSDQVSSFFSAKGQSLVVADGALSVLEKRE